MGYNAYLVTLIASAIIAVVLAIFFRRRHPAPGARAMAGLMVAVSVVSVGYIVEVLSTTPAGRQLANDIEYIGIVSVPVLWFTFVTQYSRWDTWLTRHLYLLVIIPIVTLTLVWTNNLHGLMWYETHLETYGEFLVQIKTYGPWFWVHASYSYALVLSGFVIIAMSLFHRQHLYCNQFIVLLFGGILPLIWNVIYVFRAAPTYHIDMTQPAFAISGLVIALGLFRFHILDIVPIARDIVVENMNDGVIVLDRQGRFLDLNRTAQEIIGHSATKLVGKPASMFWREQPEMEKHFDIDSKLQTELVTGSGNKRRYYELRIIPLYNRKQSVIGRVLTLHDLTERKKVEEELRTLSRQIVHLQEQERSAISRELHDDVGQTLTYLAIQLDRAGRLQPDMVSEALKEVREGIKGTIQQVRDLSHNLRPPMLESGLLPALEALAGKLGSKAGIAVEFTHAEVPAMPEELNLGVYRIVQEALTNIIRHSRASKARVQLFHKNGLVHLEIKDNGVGFDASQTTPTAGLIGMKERARSLGGELTVKSGPGAGTQVAAVLPVVEAKSERMNDNDCNR